MIDFDSLFLNNFTSFKRAGLVLRDRGLVLIRGINLDSEASISNGSGKSNLPEALTWCVWGETIKGLSKDEIVNDTVLKNCIVQTQLSVNGDKVEITRSRDHEEFGNSLVLKVNDVVYSETIQKTQEKINDLLGYDFDTFVNAKYFSQGLLKRFAQSTDSEKKDIFDKIIGLEGLKRYKAAAKETSKQIEDLIEEEEGVIQTFQEKRNEHTLRIESLELEEQSAKEQQKAELEQIKRDQESICEEIKDLRKQSEKRPQLQEKLAKLNILIANKLALEKERGNTSIKVVELKEVATIHTEKNAQIDKGLEGFTKRLSRLEGESAERLIGEPCPFCDRELTKSCLNKLRDTIKEQIRQSEEEKETHREEISKALKEAEKYRKKEKNVADTLIEVYKAEGELVTLGREVDSLSTVDDEIDKKKEKLLELEERKKSKRKKVSGFTKLKKEAQEVLEKTIENISKTKDHLEELANGKKYYEFWEVGFGNQGLKSFILDAILPILNSKVDYYTRILTGNELSISFETQSKLKKGETREKFAIDIQQKNRKRSYRAASAGEKRRIDLCVLLALQGLVSSFASNDLNIMFFDEVFDALDKVGKERVMDLLIEESKSIGSIFVITHSQELSDYFDGVVTVIKENRISRIDR